MKKKAIIAVCLYTFCLCIGEVHAVDRKTTPFIKTELEDPPHGYEEIELLGTLMYGNNPNAIVAGASDDAIYIEFNQGFGNVIISIYNNLGCPVYRTLVNTDVQQVLIIPFSYTPRGSYSVELSNANGYVDGDFDLN